MNNHFTKDAFNKVLSATQSNSPKNFAEGDLVCHSSHSRILKFSKLNGDKAIVLDKYQGIITKIELPLSEIIAYEAVYLETKVRSGAEVILVSQEATGDNE